MHGLSNWISGIVGNLDALSAHGHFQWLPNMGFGEHSHFTWKEMMVSVEWMRNIPLAASKHAQNKMDALLRWVDPHLDISEVNRRIAVGFAKDEQWQNNSAQLFLEGANDSPSFHQRDDLADIRCILQNALANRGALVVTDGPHNLLNASTRKVFFDLTSELSKVSFYSRFISRLRSDQVFRRSS